MTSKKPSPKIKVRKDYSQHIPTLSGIALLIGGIAIGFIIFGNVYQSQLYTEIISLIITIIVLDRLNEWRYERRATQELKARLVREASSRSRDIATSAVDWMRNEHWVYGKDSLLNQADLRRANLERAYLKGASLVNVQLQMANLQKANLSHVDFRHATLQRTNLNQAHLIKASFRNADLRRADLRDANLSGADLRGANLTEARISHRTKITDVLIDGTCVLPNGLLYETGGKSTEEQFNFLQGDALMNDAIIIDDEMLDDEMLDGSNSKLKIAPKKRVRRLMNEISTLNDEDLDQLLEQLDIMTHPEIQIVETSDDLLDAPLAFDEHVDEMLDDVDEQEISFLVDMENELEEDTQVKPATFTDDIHNIFDDMDDTSLTFLRNINQQLRANPNSPPVQPDEMPTEPTPPRRPKRSRGQESNSQQTGGHP